MKPAKTTNNNKQQPIKIALIGNPNCGKSSLFNVLTGLNQRTGNFSGVTVDRHIGEFNTNIGKYTLIDLPGTYSLTPKTPDELIAANVLVNKNNPDYPDLVLYVADALNLKRSLYLLTQIIDLGLPVVVAVNMIDLLEQESIPDFTLLSSCFKVPFVGISSIKKIGIDELKEKLILAKTPPTFFQPNFNRLTNLEINNPLTSYTDWINFQNKLSNEKDSLLQKNNQFRNFQVAEIADRYKKIDSLLQQANIQPPKRVLSFTERIDAIATHPLYGYLIFALILFLMFQAVFSLSTYPMDAIEWLFAEGGSKLSALLGNGIFADLLVNGVLAGISGIVVFVPQIAMLFFFIALLEDSGYMARAGLLSDRILRVFGLNGRSVISLISGMACAVPAIMGTRTIKNNKERLITILVTPFMSCSARLPVFALLISIAVPATYFAGFISYQALTLLALYLIGFITALLVAWLFTRTLKTTEDSVFAMELPVYRIPRIKTIGMLILEKTKVFVLEAGKIIMIISLVLWFLSSFGPGFKRVDKMANTPIVNAVDTLEEQSQLLEKSYVGILGKKIEPFIKPLGYDWKIGIALITSFAAREVFVGTMATIYSVGDSDNTTTLRQKIMSEKNPETGQLVFNRATGYSLMLFYLFALQCMSTIAVVHRETQSIKWPVIQFVIMFVLAYGSAFLAYQSLS